MDIIQSLGIEHRKLESDIRKVESALQSKDGDPETLARDLYDDFIAHEAVEDRTLFREIRKELGEPAVLRAMVGEHQKVFEAARAFRSAFSPLRDPEAAAEALRRFASEFRDHVRHEEETLFPFAVEILGVRRVVELGRGAPRRAAP